MFQSDSAAANMHCGRTPLHVNKVLIINWVGQHSEHMMGGLLEHIDIDCMLLLRVSHPFTAEHAPKSL